MKNKIILVLVVAAIVIVSGVYLIASKPVNVTPEDTSRAFDQYINDADGVAAADLTIWKFASPEKYNETVEDFSEMGLFYQIETHDLTVIYSNEMAQDYKIEMQNITQQYENDYNIIIQDYCYLNMSSTINHYDGNIEDMGYYNMGCLQIDDLWYLCPFKYYGEE